MIDVLSMGAVGDGIADDTAALQAAIDAAALNPFRPQAVKVPDGAEFRITAPLNVQGTNTPIFGTASGIEYTGGNGAYAASVKAGSRIFYDGPEDLTGFMLNVGLGGSNFVRAFGMRDILLDGQCLIGGVKMEQVTSSYFEHVSVARVTKGFQTGNSCYTNIWRDCDIYECSEVYIDLMEETHTADLFNCTFNNKSTERGGTSTPQAVLRIGVGGTHSSNVTVYGCNFDVYRVPYFIDAQDVIALAMHGVYMEGRDNIMVNCVKLGDAAVVDKTVLGASFSACRMSKPGPNSSGAIGAQRARGIHVNGGRVTGFSRVMDINHPDCSGISILSMSKGSGTTDANPGTALVLVA
jgi:hypothetical protein